MKHIAKFNKKFKEFCQKHSSDPIITLIEAFRKKEGISSYHLVFLKLKSLLGIDYTTKTTPDSYRSYIPYLRFNHDNVLEEASGLYPLRDQTKPFRSIDECYTFLIAKLMDRLSRIKGLEEYLELD